MQRRICRFIGACGLIVTFTTAVESARGAAGAAVSAGSSGSAAVGRAAPAASTVSAQQASALNRTAVAPSTTTAGSPTTVNGSPLNAGTPTTVNGSGTTVGGTTAATGGTVGSGAFPTTTAAGTTTAGGVGQIQANGAVGSATSTGVGGGTMSSVPFTSLPQNVQSAIVGQVPAGAQLGQIIQETTPQGMTTYRAQIMQNGVVSELSLNGAGLSATAGQSINPVTGAVNPLNGPTTTLNGTVGTLNGIPATSGVVLGTPYAFETLPAPVQSAFNSQAGGTMVTNVTYVAGANGNGIYRGFSNGRPVAVRVGSSGQILPGVPQIASTSTTIATNEVRIDDVPMAVRDSIKKSAPFGEITRIRTGETASGKLYDVTLRNGTDSTTMQVAEDGTIVRQDTEVATVSTASTTTDVATNEMPKITRAGLPVAIRDTIDARVQPKSIRTLVLTNFQGKTSYAVDYLDKDAMRHRIFIGKDGVVVNVQTNIFHIRPPSQTIVVADLPSATRNAIQAQVPDGSITRVDEAMRGSNPVYVVTYMKDGEQQQLLVSHDGIRLDENEAAARAAAIDATNAAVGAAATVETGKENK